MVSSRQELREGFQKEVTFPLKLGREHECEQGKEAHSEQMGILHTVSGFRKEFGICCRVSSFGFTKKLTLILKVKGGEESTTVE